MGWFKHRNEFSCSSGSRESAIEASAALLSSEAELWLVDDYLLSGSSHGLLYVCLSIF